MTADADVIARVWKAEAARVIGGVARIVRDVAVAEDLAQEALVAALEHWPRDGVPANPGAWLMTTARNRAFNLIKRSRVAERVTDALAHADEADASHAELEARMDRDLHDDVLRLIFTACHPALGADARVALTLRMVGGLTTPEIARAYLTTEPTIQQRIVRAKKAISEAQLPFELPRGDELGARLAAVLEVVYLIFNEGYTASSGDALMRPALSDEALRLGALLAEVAPGEPEAHALVALMHLQASRAAARVDASGEPVLLADQDRARWDRLAIARGLEALARAGTLTQAPGSYQLQAEIAACHARASTIDDTDWARIAAMYEALGALAPSPIIELNRAMAISRADGPAAGLALLDRLREVPALARYHLLPAARAELLERLGRVDEAIAELTRAAALTDNARQKARLEARAARLQDGP